MTLRKTLMAAAALALFAAAPPATAQVPANVQAAEPMIAETTFANAKACGGAEALVDLTHNGDFIVTCQDGKETYLLLLDGGGWVIVQEPRIANLTGAEPRIEGVLMDSQELRDYLRMPEPELQRREKAQAYREAAYQQLEIAQEIAGDQEEYAATLQAELKTAKAEAQAAKADAARYKAEAAKAKAATPVKAKAAASAKARARR